MADRPLPDQAALLKLLRYEPDTGKLYWRARTPDMFVHTPRPTAYCEAFNSAHAGKEAMTALDRGYLVGNIHGYGKIRKHRAIWCMVYGYWPDQVDHINQIRSDNRLVNLRNADREQNARNARMGERNRSGRIGVYWSPAKRRWRAKIRHEGRYVELGYFRDFDAACRARAAAERRYGYSPLHGSKRRAQR